MAFFTFQELIDLIVMIAVIGFIFSRIFPRRPSIQKAYDPLTHYNQNSLIEDLKYGIIIAAPAVVLHELAHKFVAISFGATATLHAPYVMYAVVLLMIFLKSPIIFFVGGYVSHTLLPPLQSALVSFSGPLTNLVLWGAFAYLSTQKIGKKNIEMFTMMKKINMFLFIFNMIPFPGFDGYNFITALFKYISGVF